MHGRRLAGGILAALLLTPGASAHTISLSPRAGDLNTPFRFTGRSWQPRGVVSWQYFVSTRATTAFRSGRFRGGGNGRFRFTWSDTALGLTHRMCFTQFDTRFARPAGTPPGRRFRKCANFYVALPSAYYDPSAGAPGAVFILIAAGFPAGRALQVTVRGPDGPQQSDSYAMTTATRGGFSPSGPFGPVFVPRGGVAFPRAAANSGAGLYTAEIREPRSNLVAYASFRLTR
jgi:hypothetical protein